VLGSIDLTFVAYTQLLLNPTLPSKLASNAFTAFELALTSFAAHTFSLEMAGGQSVQGVLLAPSLDALETRLDDVTAAVEATAC
jgi:hypothetical protein